MVETDVRRARPGTLACMVLTVLLLSACTTTKPGETSVDNGLPFPGTHRVPQVDEPQHDESGDPEPLVVSYDVHDPLVGFNRVVFACNDVLYRYALIPLGDSYRWLTPDFVEEGVRNFFTHLELPRDAIQQLLQLELGRCGKSLLRLVINSTVGVLGIFDPANAWFDIERDEARMTDTLAHYGVGYGCYLVLPLLGPSDLRGGISLIIDGVVHPVPHLTEPPWPLVIQSFDHLQDFAPNGQRYLVMTTESDDPYEFVRNLYVQGVQRDAEYE